MIFESTKEEIVESRKQIQSISIMLFLIQYTNRELLKLLIKLYQ